ncbi:hypothetical protein D9758_002215 [Tetrapyrgos nigripes]|uniref:C3H1-type domain-containing protein n=1 Tax=Tetrapyrgos nigripes TaxID=182062 RepID=A0A8H5LT57_9AGAR|nr:hypothetical protein D9758_002215 [Tetrapyrgos nigripes]
MTSISKAVRCRNYNDDGSASRYGPCTFPKCGFSHPDESSWDTATRRRPNLKDRSREEYSSRPQDSSWRGRSRQDSVGERPSGSTRRQASRDPSREDSRKSSTSKEPVTGNSSSQGATWGNSWSSNGKDKEERQSDGWGTGRGSADPGGSEWGALGGRDGGGGGGDTEGSGWDTWVGGGGAWGSASGDGGWGSTSSESVWGNDAIAASNTQKKKDAGQGTGGSFETSPRSFKTATGVADIDTGAHSNHSAADAGVWGTSFSDSGVGNNDPMVVDSQDMRSAASTVMPSSPKAPASHLPSLPGPFEGKSRDVSDSRSNTWDGVDVAESLKARKTRDFSPASTTTSFTKSDYGHIVKETIALVRLNTKLREAKHALDKWKLIQSSKQLERARKKGCDKMNQIRQDLARKVHDIEKDIRMREKALYKIPEISSDSVTRVDVVADTETLRRYAKEVETYLVDLKTFREAKCRADEEMEEMERQRLASQPPSSVEPHIQAWRDLKARVNAIEDSLHVLSDMLEDVQRFDAQENMERVEEEREANGLEPSDPVVWIERSLERHWEKLEKGRDDIALLNHRLSEFRLTELQEKMESQQKTKTELIQRLAEYREQRNQRREEINTISERIRNLHRRESPPHPYAKSLYPHIQKLVQEEMENIVPVLDTVQNEHHIASLQLRQQAVAKLNEKLFAILTLTNSVQYRSRLAEASRAPSGT